MVFLFLDWSGMTAHWADRCPTGRLGPHHTIRNKELCVTAVFSGAPPPKEEEMLPIPPPPRNYPKGLLISALQKFTRDPRNNCPATTAGALSAQLCQQGEAMALIRRLPIIAIEDSAVPYDVGRTSALVALMVLLSRPRFAHLGRSLHLARFLAAYASVVARTAVYTRDFEAKLDSTALEPGNEEYKRCIRLRMAYGGMRGDMCMLQRQCDRPLVPRDLDSDALQSWPSNHIHLFDPRKHKVLRAADFHCTSITHDLGIDADSRRGKSPLHTLMWACSSGPNRRAPPCCTEEQMVMWKRDWEALVVEAQEVHWKGWVASPPKKKKRAGTDIRSYFDKK